MAFPNKMSRTRNAFIFPDEIRYFTSRLRFFLTTIGLMQGERSRRVMIQQTRVPYHSPKMCLQRGNIVAKLNRVSAILIVR